MNFACAPRAWRCWRWGALHAAFPRRFGWKAELENVSLLTRQIFYVHHFFIALTVALQGALCLFAAPLLLDGSPLARVLAAGFALFWGARFAFQFFVYDAALWRGKPFETRIHWAAAALWLGLTTLFVLVAAK